MLLFNVCVTERGRLGAWEPGSVGAWERGSLGMSLGHGPLGKLVVHSKCGLGTRLGMVWE